MPRGDGTGPMGYGPGAGWGLGGCLGGGRRFYAFPWNAGRPVPNPAYAHPWAAYAGNELAMLKQEAGNLSDILGNMQKRICELEGNEK